MQLQLQVADTVTAATVAGEIPNADQMQAWAVAALQKINHAGGELTVRVVDAAEMAGLNSQYRGKDGPTDVLSFTFDAGELPPDVAADLEPIDANDVSGDILGDVVICAALVAAEAENQRIPLMNHWAHIVIHGILHLCGYDHQQPAEAEQMESLERGIMIDLGLPPPRVVES